CSIMSLSGQPGCRDLEEGAIPARNDEGISKPPEFACSLETESTRTSRHQGDGFGQAFNLRADARCRNGNRRKAGFRSYLPSIRFRSTLDKSCTWGLLHDFASDKAYSRHRCWPEKAGGSLAGKDSSAASSTLSHSLGGSRIDSGPAGLTGSGTSFLR